MSESNINVNKRGLEKWGSSSSNKKLKQEKERVEASEQEEDNEQTGWEWGDDEDYSIVITNQSSEKTGEINYSEGGSEIGNESENEREEEDPTTKVITEQKPRSFESTLTLDTLTEGLKSPDPKVFGETLKQFEHLLEILSIRNTIEFLGANISNKPENVMEEYLISSPECKELFDLWNKLNSTGKFKFDLTCSLSHVFSLLIEKNTFAPTLSSSSVIVRTILQTLIGDLNRNLVHENAKIRFETLRLLLACMNYGKSAARKILKFKLLLQKVKISIQPYLKYNPYKTLQLKLPDFQPVFRDWLFSILKMSDEQTFSRLVSVNIDLISSFQYRIRFYSVYELFVYFDLIDKLIENPKYSDHIKVKFFGDVLKNLGGVFEEKSKLSSKSANSATKTTLEYIIKILKAFFVPKVCDFFSSNDVNETHMKIISDLLLNLNPTKTIKTRELALRIIELCPYVRAYEGFNIFDENLVSDPTYMESYLFLCKVISLGGWEFSLSNATLLPHTANSLANLIFPPSVVRNLKLGFSTKVTDDTFGILGYNTLVMLLTIIKEVEKAFSILDRRICEASESESNNLREFRQKFADEVKERIQGPNVLSIWLRKVLNKPLNRFLVHHFLVALNFFLQYYPELCKPINNTLDLFSVNQSTGLCYIESLSVPNQMRALNYISRSQGQITDQHLFSVLVKLMLTTEESAVREQAQFCLYKWFETLQPFLHLHTGVRKIEVSAWVENIDIDLISTFEQILSEQKKPQNKYLDFFLIHSSKDKNPLDLSSLLFTFIKFFCETESKTFTPSVLRYIYSVVLSLSLSFPSKSIHSILSNCVEQVKSTQQNERCELFTPLLNYLTSVPFTATKSLSNIKKIFSEFLTTNPNADRLLDHVSSFPPDSFETIVPPFLKYCTKNLDNNYQPFVHYIVTHIDYSIWSYAQIKQALQNVETNTISKGDEEIVNVLQQLPLSVLLFNIQNNIDKDFPEKAVQKIIKEAIEKISVGSYNWLKNLTSFILRMLERSVDNENSNFPVSTQFCFKIFKFVARKFRADLGASTWTELQKIFNKANILEVFLDVEEKLSRTIMKIIEVYLDSNLGKSLDVFPILSKIIERIEKEIKEDTSYLAFAFFSTHIDHFSKASLSRVCETLLSVPLDKLEHNNKYLTLLFDILKKMEGDIIFNTAAPQERHTLYDLPIPNSLPTLLFSLSTQSINSLLLLLSTETAQKNDTNVFPSTTIDFVVYQIIQSSIMNGTLFSVPLQYVKMCLSDITPLRTGILVLSISSSYTSRKFFESAAEEWLNNKDNKDNNDFQNEMWMLLPAFYQFVKMESKVEHTELISKVCDSYLDLILTDFYSVGFHTLPRNLQLSDVITLFCKMHQPALLHSHIKTLVSDPKISQVKVTIANSVISTGVEASEQLNTSLIDNLVESLTIEDFGVSWKINSINSIMNSAQFSSKVRRPLEKLHSLILNFLSTPKTELETVSLELIDVVLKHSDANKDKDWILNLHNTLIRHPEFMNALTKTLPPVSHVKKTVTKPIELTQYKLVRVLHTIYTLCSQVCTPSTLLILLSVYNATTSPTDMIIFRMFNIFEKHGILLQSMGYIFGNSATLFFGTPNEIPIDKVLTLILDGKVFDVRLMHASLEISLRDTPLVLNDTNQDLPEFSKSINSTPLLPPLSNSSGLSDSMSVLLYEQFTPHEHHDSKKHTINHAQFYNPSFILPMIHYLLSLPPSQPNLLPQRLFENKILQYVITMLSSFDELVRILAGKVLAIYVQRLNQSYFREKHQVELVCTLLQNAITTEGQRVPNLFCSVLAHSLTVISDAANYNYPIICKFLIATTKLDVGFTPLRYLLKPQGQHASKILKWYLRLIRISLHQPLLEDIQLIKNIISQLIFTYQNLPIADEVNIKPLILLIFETLSQTRTGVLALINHGILSWVSQELQKTTSYAYTYHLLHLTLTIFHSVEYPINFTEFFPVSWSVLKLVDKIRNNTVIEYSFAEKDELILLSVKVVASLLRFENSETKDLDMKDAEDDQENENETNGKKTKKEKNKNSDNSIDNNDSNNKTNNSNNENNHNSNNNHKSKKKRIQSVGCRMFYLTPQNFLEFAGLCLNSKWSGIKNNINESSTIQQTKSLLIEIALNQPWKTNLEKENTENSSLEEEDVIEILIWCAKTLVQTPCFQLVNVIPFNNEIASKEGLLELLIEKLHQYITNKKIFTSLTTSGIAHILANVYNYAEWHLSNNVLFKLNLLMVKLMKKLRKQYKENKPWSENHDKTLKKAFKTITRGSHDINDRNSIEEHNKVSSIVREVLEL